MRNNKAWMFTNESLENVLSKRNLQTCTPTVNPWLGEIVVPDLSPGTYFDLCIADTTLKIETIEVRFYIMMYFTNDLEFTLIRNG